MLLTQAIVAVAFLWCFVRASHFAWYAMFTNFASYDDEGCLLLSYREFLLGRPLYDQVFTLYGPASFAFKHLLSIFQGLPTHEITRHTTLLLWLSSCTALGAAALWLTRSGTAAIAVFGAMVPALMAMRSEPGHPQDLLVFLTSLSVAIAASPVKPYTRAVMLTVVTALCAFVKINVGIFVGLATVATLLPVDSGTVRTVLALAMAAIPPVLMLRHLSAWAWPYALAASAAILTGVVSASDSGVRVWPLRKGAPFVAAALLPPALLVVYLLVRNSTMMGILDGLLLRPLSLADVYANPFRLPIRPVALSLAAAALALSASRRESAVAGWLSPLLPAVKIATGFYLLFWVGSLQETVAYGAIAVFALLAGIESMPPRDRFGRVFLGLSAAFHSCIAYPVAGSQMWWSTFLLIMTAIICIWDGASRLRSAAAAIAPVQRTLATAIVCLALCMNFWATTPVDAMIGAYRSAVALPFEGATSVHIDPAQAGAYGWLVANLRGHCSNFTELPGFNSLHTWSGIRPPTGFNGAAWMSLINDVEQTETVERLRQERQPCAVYSPSQLALWTSQPVNDRPLAGYVLGMVTVAEQAGYQIRVPPTDTAAWTFDYLLAGRRSFNPSTPSYPSVLAALKPVSSVRLWFRTREHGVLLGAQSGAPGLQPRSWCPLLYLGQDGRLRAELWNKKIEPITSVSALNDGVWHHVALVSRTDRQTLYIDGMLIGEIDAPVATTWGDTLQIGNGFTADWPEANGAWLPFSGEVRDAIVAPRAWDTDAVFRDFVLSADGEASH